MKASILAGGVIGLGNLFDNLVRVEASALSGNTFAGKRVEVADPGMVMGARIVSGQDFLGVNGNQTMCETVAKEIKTTNGFYSNFVIFNFENPDTKVKSQMALPLLCGQLGNETKRAIVFANGSTNNSIRIPTIEQLTAKDSKDLVIIPVEKGYTQDGRQFIYPTANKADSAFSMPAGSWVSDLPRIVHPTANVVPIDKYSAIPFFSFK